MSYRHYPTRKECYKFSFASLFAFCGGLLLFAIEGLICVIMAAPLALLCTWLGSILTYAARNKIEGRTPTMLGIAFLLTPSLFFIEHSANDDFPLIPITTSVEVNAPAKVVWKNVVEFSTLKEP